MTVATLAGYPLSGIAPIQWPQTATVRPFRTTMTVERRTGEAIFAAQAPLSAEPGTAGNLQPLTMQLGERFINTVLCIGKVAGPDRNTISLELTDTRWLWTRRMFARSYNVRQRTGERSLRGEGLIENKVLTPDIKYADWSLRNFTTPWTLKEAFEDVLTDLGVKFVVPDFGAEADDIFEDFDEIAPAGNILELLFRYAPTYNLTLEDDGTVVIFNTHDGGEEAELALAPAPIFGQGRIGKSDLRFARPSSVVVYFTPETELRFDYSSTQSTSSVDPARPPRELENVLALPDRSLTVNGRELGQGTWVEFGEFYDAIAGSESTLVTSKWGRMNDVAVRQTYFQPQVLEQSFAITSNADPIPLWQRRIRSIRKHWRRFFRIPRRWADRMRSIRAYRVGIIDAENRSRAPAQAFTDYIRFPVSTTGDSLRLGDSDNYGINETGYNALLSQAVVAPSDVTVRDEDAKIIKVHLVGDPLGGDAYLAPGTSSRLPTRSISARARGNFDALRTSLFLDAQWNLAVVLTAVKAGPNSTGRMFGVRVTPSDVEPLVGTLGVCEGPTLEVVVGEGPTTTARVAWTDGESTAIEDFFFNGLDPVNLSEVGSGGGVAGLINNAEHIEAMAKAAAAQVYMQFADRNEGRVVTVQDGAAARPKVRGSLGMITTTVDSQGRAFDAYDCPRVLKVKDFFSLLPPGVRRVIRGNVQP